MKQEQVLGDKDAAVASQAQKAIPSDLRCAGMLTGVVCWIIALISAGFAVLLVIIMVEKGSFDGALFAKLGFFIFFTFVFGALGRRYCRRQPVDAIRSYAVPRGLSIMKGVLFLIFALIMGSFAVLLDSCFISNKDASSFCCESFAGLVIIHFLSLICVLLALKYLQRQPVDIAKTSAVTSKYNDPVWCMGVGGIAGGAIGLLLSLRHVIEVFRSHTLVIYSFVMLLGGLYCYFRWRRRTRCDAWCQAYSEIYRRAASTFLFIAVTSNYDRILFGRPKEPFSIRPRKPLTQDELEDLVKESVFTQEVVTEILERRKDGEMMKETKKTQDVSTQAEDLSVTEIPIWYRTAGEWDEGATFPIRLLPNMLAEFASHANEGICIDGSEPQRVKYILGMTEDFHYYVDIIGAEAV